MHAVSAHRRTGFGEYLLNFIGIMYGVLLGVAITAALHNPMINSVRFLAAVLLFLLIIEDWYFSSCVISAVGYPESMISFLLHTLTIVSLILAFTFSIGHFPELDGPPWILEPWFWFSLYLILLLPWNFFVRREPGFKELSELLEKQQRKQYIVFRGVLYMKSVIPFMVGSVVLAGTILFGSPEVFYCLILITVYRFPADMWLVRTGMNLQVQGRR